MEHPKTKFLFDEEVVCQDKKKYYLAKCINIRPEETECMYLIHYIDWEDIYDEWVSEERIFKMTQENFEKLNMDWPENTWLPLESWLTKKQAPELAKLNSGTLTSRVINVSSSVSSATAVSTPKAQKRRSTSSTSSISPTKKKSASHSKKKKSATKEEGGDESESDFDYEAEISDMKRKKKVKSEKRLSGGTSKPKSDANTSNPKEASKKKSAKKFNLKLSSRLLYFLINDNDLISYRQSLTRLPSSRPVKAVFSDFQKYSKKNCPELKVKATTKFIEKVFNR